MVNMKFEDIKELFESAGYEPMSYSGRGMFGRRCLAVRVSEHVFNVLLDVISEFACEADDLNYQTLDHLLTDLRGAKTDSLGFDTVLYWPGIDWEDDEEEEEEEVDDSVSVHSPVSYR